MTAEDRPAAASFPEKFAALAQAWRAQLPQRLHEAQHRLQALRADPSDGASLQELHRILHTLAGSAGTFGMPDVSIAAKAAEHECDRLMDSPHRAAGDFEDVTGLVDALVRATEA
ncbi:Hpt domain-containing protein [Ramlibacter humi]|uniref:HPt domain-containing protein n=1 Tax=Ramlibacter humi TaxID=2530451 RepID=A0A4Z0BBY0_9BURK|nr:Hpt domain-containing protein [Ramlibacter humi]TFY96702.1 hypothetical protein EZ216_20180 [Ramlibacter humi]